MARPPGRDTRYPRPSSGAVSAVMRGNKKVDTRPEIAVRRLLHAEGLRYRVNYPIVTGAIRVRPDVVLTRSRIAVFIDGCFWHGCPEHGTRPRVNARYWKAKLARNRARDALVSSALQAAGWVVIRAWEHEPAPAVAGRVRRTRERLLVRGGRVRRVAGCD